ncbi:MAG: GTP cyclohydrolase I [Parcubacteria group bacterium GW2011_GWA2_43_17]|nr:MAG: GTP cyclohydrolase I [Parcubacteria group bacterium GW2011_GWA2_43_17]
MNKIKKTSVDAERIKRAVKEILLAVGEDVSREGLIDTPDRVARMYVELLSGMSDSPDVYFESAFTENYDEIVLLRNIPFYSICEHHLMPFIGKAHVAYLPKGKVLGVSKLARIVDSYAHRLQLQERFTSQIADSLMSGIKPMGVVVVIEASHSCMTIRGIKKPGAVMVTSTVRGLFRSDQRARSEVMSLLHDNHI